MNRCYAALGDVAKVRYLHNLNDIAQSKKNDVIIYFNILFNILFNIQL